MEAILIAYAQDLSYIFCSIAKIIFYCHTVNEEEFGFNRDEHHYIHRKLNKNGDYKMQNLKKSIKVTVVTLALSFTTIYAQGTQDHSPEEHSSHKGHAGSQKEENHESHGHSHRYDDLKNEVSREAIEKAAMQKVQSLVAEKKIPKSWKSVPISKIGKTHYGDTDDWVVGFDNIKIKNKKRGTLYIFVSVRGEIRGANYTGN